MARLLRVRARWAGFTGAPGYSIFHFRDFAAGNPDGDNVTATEALAAVARVRTFFDAIKGLIPSTASVQIDAEVDVIEDTDGVLQTSFTVAQPAIVTGTGSGTFAAAVGAVVNWRTDLIRKRRRMRGRTFLVPLSGSAFTTGGQISAASLTTLQGAASALANTEGTPDLMVYGRPTTTGATDGVSSIVVSSQVPAMGAVLTSRRD